MLPEAACVTQDRSEAKPTPEEEVKETAHITKSKKDDVFMGKSGNFASRTHEHTSDYNQESKQLYSVTGGRVTKKLI